MPGPRRCPQPRPGTGRATAVPPERSARLRCPSRCRRRRPASWPLRSVTVGVPRGAAAAGDRTNPAGAAVAGDGDRARVRPEAPGPGDGAPVQRPSDPRLPDLRHPVLAVRDHRPGSSAGRSRRPGGTTVRSRPRHRWTERRSTAARLRCGSAAVVGGVAAARSALRRQLVAHPRRDHPLAYLARGRRPSGAY